MSRLSTFLRQCRHSIPRPWRREPRSARAVGETKARSLARARRELECFLASDRRLAFEAASEPRVSVLVVAWNQAHHTLRCLEALAREHAAGETLDIVIVDNASNDQTAAVLERLSGVRVIRNSENIGFLRGCNQAAAMARGRHLLLLNNDAVVRPGAIGAAVACLESSSDIGAVGGRLILPDGRLQEAGSIVWSDGTSAGYARGRPPEASEAMFRRDVDYCSGAFLLTPRAVWDQFGGFDSAFAPAYYEEADYCLRLWAIGKRVVYEPAAAIDHFEFGSEPAAGASRGLMERHREVFVERHAAVLGDRHSSPGDRSMFDARTHWSRRRPRLLILDNELPCEALGAGYPRMRRLVAEAVAAGWEVTFFPLHAPDIDWAEAWRELPAEVEIAAGLACGRLGEFLAARSGAYHTVLVSRPDNMRLVRPILAAAAAHVANARIVYDAEALFAARTITARAVSGRPMPAAEAEALVAEEAGLAAGADAVICVSPREVSEFRRRTTARVYCASHPVSLRPDSAPFACRSGYLFVGRLRETDAPNWVGLVRFLAEVWPLIRRHDPAAVLRVVGHVASDHAPLLADGVEILGPRADVAPLYDASRVFVAPTFIAAGVPIKILDAAAAGLPVVTYPLMARLLGWTNGVEIVAEEQGERLAAAASRLHDDRSFWQAIRAASLEAVAREHSAEAFRQAIRAALSDAPS